MSKIRLTKEEKKIRKELNRYHNNLEHNREARKTRRKATFLALLFMTSSLIDRRKKW